VQRDARIAGLRDFQTPSLEAVERRRRQLWVRTASALAAVAVIAVALTTLPSGATPTGTNRALVVVLAIVGSFFLWAFHKQAALERLTRSLTD